MLVRTAAAAAGLVGATLVVVEADPARAGNIQIFPVTTTEDELDPNPEAGAGVSLRERMQDANFQDGDDNHIVIELQRGQTYRLDLCAPAPNQAVDEEANATGDLDQTSSARVDIVSAGPGTALATIEQTCPSQRVVERHASANTRVIAFEGVRITGGSADSGVAGGGTGGGIRSAGEVRLREGTVVEGNRALLSGGGIFAGGLLDVSEGSTIRDNRADGSGLSSNGGGALAQGGLDLARANVTGNLATGNGGGISASGLAEVVGSTISGNRAFVDAGGLRAEDLVLLSSTISQNQAGGDAGGLLVTDDAEIRSATIVANRAPEAATITVYGDLTIFRMIVGMGSDGVDCDLRGTIGGNPPFLGADESCLFVADPPLHPMIAPLADNGGLTLTHRPVTPSPAIDAYGDATPEGCELIQDQRGVIIPEAGDAGCDAGSLDRIPAPCVPTFPDVSGSSTFFDEICWLSQMGITGGFVDGTFNPAAPVTRQSMAAFLYRLALSPPFQGGVTIGQSFSDVPQTHPFFDEIEWMAANGIAGGFDDGTFRSGQPVSRQAMSAFLFRVAGEPPPPGPLVQTFDDVGLSHPFFEEITWMANAGVSTGFDDDTYRPSIPVSRQAMAAFLLRLAAEVPLLGL
jgi:predicted outer membrane repeat protein